MLGFFRSLFGTDFMPHLYCLRGEPGVLWLHVVSDLLIALAYFAIPVALARVMFQRKDPAYRVVAGLFVLFIAACGVTHVLAVWTIWVPMYRLEGLAKAVTAVLSLATALALIQLRSYLSRIPSVQEMEREMEHRARATALVHEQEELFRAFVDSVEDYAIYMIDPSGTVLSWNQGAEKIKGYSAAEALGGNFSRFYTLEDREAMVPQRNLALAQASGCFQRETLLRRRDGTEFVANVTMRPVFGVRGELRGYSEVSRDVTEARELESRFETLLEAVPDAIVIVNPEGDVEFFNRAAEGMYGYSREEILGRSSDLLVSPAWRAQRAEFRARLASELDRWQSESCNDIEGMRKDGIAFPVEFRVSPMETRAGRVLIFAVRDLTEQRKTELRFQALLEAVPDAIIVISVSERIEYVNRRAEEMFGRARLEFVGQSADVISPERFREQRRVSRTRYFESGAVTAMGETGEHFCLRRDGTEFPVESSVTPLTTAGGPVLLASLRDISERKKTEARFQALLESAPDAMVIVNQEGRIELANLQMEKLFGHMRSELIGQSLEVLIPEPLRGCHGDHLKVYFRDPRAREMGAGLNLMALRRDGTQFPVEISLSPLDGPEGISVTAAIRDISERRQQEESLREKEEWFRSFVDGVEDYAIYMLDPEGIVQSWNQGAQRMKGYVADEIVGQSFSRFYTAADQAAGKDRETLRIALETGRYQGEVWRVRKDGTLFLANVVMRPLWKPSGELGGFSKVTRDLTETLEMEMRYRTLLEAAPDAIVIVNVQGEIDFINSQAERLFGYERRELIGKPVDFLVPPRARDVQGDYLEELFEGAAHPAPHAPPETFGLRKDGSDFPLEFSASPLDTKEGRVMLFAVRDLTEKRRSEARFRALLNSAPDAMVISGADGLIELTNLQAERLFGYSVEEMVGQPVTMLIPEELREGYGEDSVQFLHGDFHRRMGAGLELRARSKDGSEIPVEISFSPLEGPSGVSMTAAIRDVTERVAAARHLAEKMTELRQSNEALEQFAHIASHDLQEPLRMVASYTQLLSKRYKGRLDADADEFIGFAVDGTQRMKRLIEDLLVYSRAGRGAPSVYQLSSEQALQEALYSLRASIEESHAEVTHEALPAIATGKLQLVQLFQNLVGNAIKYRGERTPRIHISAHKEEAAGGQEWVFSVSDNGIGIEPQYFERVFVIFQRLHGHGEYEGTGIGLAICKRVLQQQGGRIWVESEPGNGSVFHFALPVR